MRMVMGGISLGLGGKFFQVAPAKSEGALRESVSGSCANSAGTAHDHVGNGAGGFAKVFGADDFEFVREQALFDEADGIRPVIESDRAKVCGAAVDRDVHGAKI